MARRTLAVDNRTKLAADDKKALVAITLDLEMSRAYPTREQSEWDYEKGNLDESTKNYAVRAAQIVRERGGILHFFCVGRVLEQPDVGWLKELAAAGHPIGNHTYDHINLGASSPSELQHRFQRSPWLVEGKTTQQVIRENIRLTDLALKERIGIRSRGFRTPGNSPGGLMDRPDLQKLLLELGFTWVSSQYPAHQTGATRTEPTDAVYADIVAKQEQAQPFVYPSRLIEVPVSPMYDLKAFRTNGWKLSWFLRAVEKAVEYAIATGGVFDFVSHPSCLVVEDPQFEAINLICDRVQKAGDRAAIVDLDTIAERARLRMKPQK